MFLLRRLRNHFNVIAKKRSNLNAILVIRSQQQLKMFALIRVGYKHSFGSGKVFIIKQKRLHFALWIINANKRANRWVRVLRVVIFAVVLLLLLLDLRLLLLLILFPNAAQQINTRRWTKKSFLIAIGLLRYFSVNNQNTLVFSVSQIASHNARAKIWFAQLSWWWGGIRRQWRRRRG